MKSRITVFSYKYFDKLLMVIIYEDVSAQPLMNAINLERQLLFGIVAARQLKF